MKSGYVGALDQGTTSTRFIIFDTSGDVVASSQAEHDQILPRPGWVEHDPIEIRDNVSMVVARALERADLRAGDLETVGITNQRETTVVWDRTSGQPLTNAIVWQDTRTADLCVELAGGEGPDRFRGKTGLPLATYFAGPKMRWLIDELDIDGPAKRGDIAVGTIDSWLLWNLCGVHVTDATNASRTMLMDLETTAWDDDLALALGVPVAALPEISPSLMHLPIINGPLKGVPVTAVLGDQQAALFGQACFEPGQAKNTYGTGNFMLMNTGAEAVPSEAGLLTTVAFQEQGSPAVYALEGSIAVTGSLIQWLRDNLGLIESASEVETVAASVDDNGDVYFVPAFSGLFAPRWRPDARGVLVGMTRYTNRGHIARAALEAAAFQTQEVLAAMTKDSRVELTELRVDGGMTANSLLMQFQSDVLGVDVVRPRITETTALGAAYAAGIAAGIWGGTGEVAAMWAEERRWSPSIGPDERERLVSRWDQAVRRSFDWV